MHRTSKGFIKRRSLADFSGFRQFLTVTNARFADSTLIVLGHGTDLNAGSSVPVRQHAAELRRRNIFADVREAFWKQEPKIKDVLAAVTTPRAFIVPLFVSEGYFASEVIPKDLGFDASRITHHASHVTYYCQPVGSHDSMTAVILARAEEVLEKFPFPRAPKTADVTLFIAGHGTEKNENSRKPIDRQVELIRAKKIYADVHAIFLDEAPRVPECYALAKTKNMVVVPFFISDGLHVVEDIPVLLGEPERIVKQRLDAGQPTWRNPSERNDKMMWYTPAVGTEPHIPDVILERVFEAAKMEDGK